MYKDIEEWVQSLLDFKIPRWQDLPGFELYSDQVIQLIDDFVKDVVGDDNIITAAMINNYVKLKAIPKPIKKKYTKVHIAYLIAITMLKQVLTIEDISRGITYQSKTSGGLKEAYDIFADEMERSIHNIGLQMLGRESEINPYITIESQAMHFTADAFAGKIVAKKLLKQYFIGKEVKE